MTGSTQEAQQAQMIQHILLLKRSADDDANTQGADLQTVRRDVAEEVELPKSKAAQSTERGARTLRHAQRDPADDLETRCTQTGDAVPDGVTHDVDGGGRGENAKAGNSWYDSGSSGAETPPDDDRGERMWGFESSSSSSVPPTPPESDAEIPHYDWKQWATASEALRLELFGRSDWEIQRAMGLPRKHALIPHRRRRSWNLGLGDFESDEDG